MGLAFNEMVRNRELSDPILIGRDHLDFGLVTSLNREIESMQADADTAWNLTLFNTLLSVTGGAACISVHHGGGVGMKFSQCFEVVTICDGTEEAGQSKT